MAAFFISCPLHFENQLADEIKTFWFEMMDLDGQPTRESLPEFKIEQGGIEVKCPDHLGYQINFFSKLAHRVLVRIHQFEARFYDQFEREMKQIPLSKWIAPGQIKVKVETVKSRLNHERNILEVCEKTLPSQGFKLTDSDRFQHQLFIRIVKDRVVLSLDTSGEHLHRRGYAVYRGEAPLRENLAALLAYTAKENGFDPQTNVLVDPFVGSGTILFEAASLNEPNFKRSYAWLSFLNKPKIFNSDSWIKNFRWLQAIKKFQMVGIDNDEKAVSNLEKNRTLFREMFPTIDLELKAIHHDSSTLSGAEFSKDKPHWIISNPPYGIRLKNDSVTQVFPHLESILPLDGAVILHPESMKVTFRQLKLSSQIDFSNQGLNIKMSVYTR